MIMATIASASCFACAQSWRRRSARRLSRAASQAREAEAKEEVEVKVEAETGEVEAEVEVKVEEENLVILSFVSSSLVCTEQRLRKR